MALKIRLGDADRERFGCPEWIEYDDDTLMQTEAEILDDFGLTWEGELRWGTPVVDSDGQPVHSEHGVQLRTFRAKTWRVWVWVALRRAGVVVPFDELDFNQAGMTVRSANPADGASEGKGPDSETSGDTTPPSSQDSGTGRRRSQKGSATTSSATTEPLPTS